MHTPPIGWRVLWYPHASKDNGPTVADVTAIYNNGSVDLTLVPPRGGECRHVRSVRHVEDPALVSHPNFKVKSGGWDWVEGLVPVMVGGCRVGKSLNVASDEPQGEMTSKVLELAELGMDPAEIAKELKIKGLTKDRAKEIIDASLQNA